MILSQSQTVVDAIIQARGCVLIDLPNTDEHAVCRDFDAVKRFIAKYGDQTVRVVDFAKRLQVPAFAKGRKSAIAAKSAWCDLYGSE